jgi:DNA-binding response OmpR family regulator
VHAQPEDRRNFIASGFDEVLVKPINVDALVAALATISRQHGLRGSPNVAPG